MDMSFEDQIRERAYQIWLAGGMADGQAHDHWVCAEQAVLGEVVATEPVVIITKAEPKPAKLRTAAAKATGKATAAKATAKATAAKPTAAKPSTAKPTAGKAPRAKAKAEL